MPQQIELKVSGIDVAIAYANECDQTVTQREIEAYIDRAHAQHPGQVLQSLNLDVDGEDVAIDKKLQEDAEKEFARILG